MSSRREAPPTGRASRLPAPPPLFRPATGDAPEPGLVALRRLLLHRWPGRALLGGIAHQARRRPDRVDGGRLGLHRPARHDRPARLHRRRRRRRLVDLPARPHAAAVARPRAAGRVVPLHRGRAGAAHRCLLPVRHRAARRECQRLPLHDRRERRRRGCQSHRAGGSRRAGAQRPRHVGPGRARPLRQPRAVALSAPVAGARASAGGRPPATDDGTGAWDTEDLRRASRSVDAPDPARSHPGRRGHGRFRGHPQPRRDGRRAARADRAGGGAQSLAGVEHRRRRADRRGGVVGDRGDVRHPDGRPVAGAGPDARQQRRHPDQRGGGAKLAALRLDAHRPQVGDGAAGLRSDQGLGHARDRRRDGEGPRRAARDVPPPGERAGAATWPTSAC